MSRVKTAWIVFTFLGIIHQFIFPQSKELVHEPSKNCLDSRGLKAKDNAHLNPCDGSEGQKWEFSKVSAKFLSLSLNLPTSLYLPPSISLYLLASLSLSLFISLPLSHSLSFFLSLSLKTLSVLFRYFTFLFYLIRLFFCWYLNQYFSDI